MNRVNLKFKIATLMVFVLLFSSSGYANVSSTIEMQQQAQGRTVRGSVEYADDNAPASGVTVVVKGTTNGVITDPDGNFTIGGLSADDVLIFSFIGLVTQEVVVGEQQVINISMASQATDLDEVVAIGYGTQKKRDLSGAVAQVKTSEILEGNPAPSINQALQGRMAGVVVNQNDGAPGAGISIQVRGTNSFSTNSQPLYIVDGIPYDVAAMPTSDANNNNNQTSNALAGINPNDIESIEVLKDASATSIYGSRGANGVVIITTKKGTKGNDKLEFTSNFTVSTIGKKVEMLDGYNYANYINEQYLNSAKYEGQAYDNLHYSGQWTYQPDENGNNIPSSGEYFPSPEDFLNQGLRTDEFGNTFMVEDTDWQDEIYQTSFSQEYNLSASGGSDKGWYSFSGNYLTQEGIIKNSGYDRFAVRANIGRNVRTWLELGTNISYTNSRTNFSKSNAYDYGIIRSAMLFPSAYGSDIETDTNDELSWLASNPKVYVETAKDELRSVNVFSSSYANIKLTKDLNFRQNVGLNYSNNNRGTYYNRQTQEGRTPINGRAGLSDNWYQAITLESLLQYNKDLNEDHNINAVAGFTYENANYGNKSLSASNFPTDITEYYDISQGLVQDVPVSGRGETALTSLLARANYSYKGKYIVTASFRRDGSSKFVEGNKFANFASGALAWRISEEEFIKNLNFFDNLKLRASYGQTGNQGINAYQTQVFLATANYPYGGSLSSGFSEVDWRGALNPNLKWETTDQYNVGLDMSILNSRLNLTVDYYKKETNDLLQQVGIPSSSGFTTQWTNSGNVTNEGLEFTIQASPIRNNNFSWDINANISFNKNEIGGLEGDQYGPELWYGVNQFYIQRNGMPIGAMFGYVEDGFYDSEAEVLADPVQVQAGIADPMSMVGEIKYRDLNEDGVINAEDRTIIGDANPDYVFGITNNFKYKNFTLSFFLQGSVGNDIFNGNLIDVGMGNVGNIPVEAYEDRWVDGADNSGARFPKATRGYTRNMLISDRFVEDATYIRLKNVNIGYNFTPKFKGIDKIHVYGSATNLFTITGYSWFDPDVNAFAGDPSRKGVDIYSYPTSRNFSIGVKVEF